MDAQTYCLLQLVCEYILFSILLANIYANNENENEIKQKRKQKFVSTQISAAFSKRRGVEERDKAILLAMRVCRNLPLCYLMKDQRRKSVCTFLFFSFTHTNIFSSVLPLFFVSVIWFCFPIFRFPVRRAMCLWLNRRGNLSINSTGTVCRGVKSPSIPIANRKRRNARNRIENEYCARMFLFSWISCNRNFVWYFEYFCGVWLFAIEFAGHICMLRTWKWCVFQLHSSNNKHTANI